MTSASRPKPKPMKIGQEIAYEIDGAVFVLRKVEPTVTPSIFVRSQGTKDQKARYEIVVDGVVRGFIHCETGFGSVWNIVAHGNPGPHAYTFEMKKPHVVYPTKYASHEERCSQDRDTLIAQVPRLLREKQLPTRAELDRRVAQKDARDAARAKDDREKGIALRRQAHQDRIAANAEREERLQALEGLRDRLRASLSNQEADALVKTIELLARDVETARQHEEAFYSED